MSVEVRGADTLRRTLSAAESDLRDLTAANRRAGQLIALQARIIAPRRTGRLRSAITVTATRHAITLKDTAPYAAYVNFGTKHVRARPFLTGPAKRADRWFTAYEIAVSKALNKIRGV